MPQTGTSVFSRRGEARLDSVHSCTSGRQLKRSLILLILVICELSSVTGCATFHLPWGRRTDPLAGLPRTRFSHDPQVEEVVDYLNANVQKLNSWQAHSVSIRANGMPLRGMLAVEKGQHLRLNVESLRGTEVDLGSNDEVFWIKAKAMEPSYVYCKHTEIDYARRSLGVPFEPQWLMQALGVAPVDPKNLRMKIDAERRRAVLFQPVITAHGHSLEKVMVVDLNHGVILEHSVLDSAKKTVAQASLEDFHVDKKSGVILPHRVKLNWPQNQMSLVMHMERVEINPTSIPTRVWQMPPAGHGVQIVNLGADAHNGIRFAERERDPSYELMEPEDSTSDSSPGRVHMTSEEGDQNPASEKVPKSRSTLVDPIRFEREPIAQPKKKRWDED